MKQLDRFIEHHRKPLIRYLEYRRDIPSIGEEALKFIDQVLDDWDSKLGVRDLPPQDRHEMTFWYSLYRLEVLAELPDDQPLMPFELMMFDVAEDCLSLLSHQQALPGVYYATRPTQALSQLIQDQSR